jgi:predicted ATPase
MAGRQPEMALLRNGLKDAASGREHVFLISGEPGIGKTRLADEIAAAAGMTGAVSKPICFTRVADLFFAGSSCA